jgi:hypothetical protein
MSKTLLYLLGNGLAEPVRSRPELLFDPPLSPLGLRQAEATRDFLAVRPLDRCFTAPQRAACQTAAVVTGPHRLTPVPLDGRSLDELLELCAGQAALVVAPLSVLRVYLGDLLGFPAGLVTLAPCGVSGVMHDGDETTVRTLNAAFHLQGVAA